MSTTITIHKVAKIEISEKHDQKSFFHRSIIITDGDGNTTEISLLADSKDGEPPQALDLRI